MSSDRFQFLEFGDEEKPPADASVRQAGSEPVQREIGSGLLLPDGTTLAQVRMPDPRGFQKYVDEDEGMITLSSMAGQSTQVPNRFRIVEVLGERGTNVDQFQYPTGIAVDPEGVLFVADSYSHRVKRITPDGGVSAIGGRGSGRAQFLSPQGVATDEDGSFYVVEQGNCRVQKFTREGVLTLVFGRSGRDDGEFQGPTAIAVAPHSGDIYVADTGNSRIQRFSQEGRFLNTLGAPGQGPGLSSPQAVAADQGGALYAAETFAQRLVRFDPLGRMDQQIGGSQSRRSRSAAPQVSLHQPRALALDPAGLLYVADAGEPDPLTGETRGRLQCLSLMDGLPVIATVEKIGRSLGSLLRPGGLAVGPPFDRPQPGRISWGDLYVSDTMNHRILRFAWSGAA
ncbi:MAG: NHL repeat-containing protein [Janthinobacterium lividum]